MWLQVVRNVASGSKFYQLPLDKENTVFGDLIETLSYKVSLHLK